MNQDAGPIRPTTPQLSSSEATFELFVRGLAVLSAAFGLAYWVRLVGIYDGLAWRFDLMPAHWQAASVSLAVLYPFAACGLWMLASWGAVIWLFCVVIEIAIYGGFPDAFVRRDALLAIHGACLVAYGGFIAHRLAKRRGLRR